MHSEVPREQLEAERRRLEQEFQQLTTQARHSPCMQSINARKCARLIERLAEIEEQLSGQSADS